MALQRPHVHKRSFSAAADAPARSPDDQDAESAASTTCASVTAQLAAALALAQRPRGSYAAPTKASLAMALSARVAEGAAGADTLAASTPPARPQSASLSRKPKLRGADDGGAGIGAGTARAVARVAYRTERSASHSRSANADEPTCKPVGAALVHARPYLAAAAANALGTAVRAEPGLRADGGARPGASDPLRGNGSDFASGAESARTAADTRTNCAHGVPAAQARSSSEAVPPAAPPDAAAAAAAEAADVSAKASTGVRLERLGRRPSASLLRRGRAALPTVAHRASLTAPNVRAWLCGT